jgi:hypothetical protein
MFDRRERERKRKEFYLRLEEILNKTKSGLLTFLFASLSRVVVFCFLSLKLRFEMV